MDTSTAATPACVASAGGRFAVSLRYNIWSGERSLLAIAADGPDGDSITLRGRAYRMVLRLAEMPGGSFGCVPGDELFGGVQRQLPDGEWIGGDVLLPADRRLLPKLCASIAAWASMHAVELARETAATCDRLLAEWAPERAAHEAGVTAGRERLAALQSQGGNTNRVERRLNEDIEWLRRCDRWEATAADTVERMQPVIRG